MATKKNNIKKMILDFTDVYEKNIAEQERDSAEAKAYSSINEDKQIKHKQTLWQKIKSAFKFSKK